MNKQMKKRIGSLISLLAGIIGLSILSMPLAHPAAAAPATAPLKQGTPTITFPTTSEQEMSAQLIQATLDQATAVLSAGNGSQLAAPEVIDLGDWTNGAATACIATLAVVFSPTWGASFVPSPFQKAFEWAAFLADLGLKHCAPVVEPPPDLVRRPANNGCSTPLYLPRNGQSGNTLEGEYSAILGFPTRPADYGINWGHVGRPFVYHFNSDVEILLTYYGTRSGDYVNFPVGIHDLTWRGETTISPIDILFIPLGTGYSKDQIKQMKNSQFVREIVKNILVEAGIITLDQTVVDGWRHGIYNEEVQRLAVLDEQAPTITRLQNQIVVEAVEPGGVSRLAVQQALFDGVAVTDNCDTDPLLLPLGLPDFLTLGTHSFTWKAADDGPRTNQGGLNETLQTHSIRVQDTMPPIIVAPPSIVTETASTPVSLWLGQPMIFDLADLSPTCTVSSSAGGATVACDQASTTFTFNPGITTLTWRAEDDGGNDVTAVQTVNVKPVGTNRTSQADNQTATAISYEPITLTLTSSDPDADPLWFQLTDWPDSGFFIAPLYPYFIEDYRVESSDTIQDLCAGNPGAVQTDFPYEALYVAVADDGTSYVVDQGDIFCYSGGGSDTDHRIAIFDADGNLQAATVDTGGNDIDSIYIDEASSAIYVTYTSQQSPYVDRFNLTTLVLEQKYRIDYVTPPPGWNTMNDPSNAVVDSQGVLYVTDGNDIFAVSATDVTGEVPALLGPIYHTTGSNIEDMAIDSNDNLYVSLENSNRILKFTPSGWDGQGNFLPAQIIGWLGKCDQDLGNGSQVHCDEANQRSVGFSCTDATCGIATAPDPACLPGQIAGLCTAGGDPGQFNQPRGIAFDPNDNLYVTDYNNFRAQRFTPDGFFAGEAVSECDGSCFVLGDFGKPEDISVNSTHFYIIDQETNLLHVSETTPITPIDGSSAQVVYQSENNFVGSDSFRFVTTDGLATSSEATVNLNVSRNYRPPFAREGLALVTPEDTAATVILTGNDPDAPLDVFTFTITEPPQSGTLAVVSSNGYEQTMRYTPQTDFEGSDSFAYTVSDGRFVSAAEWVTITVQPRNDAPIIEVDSSFTIGAGYETTFDASFSDPDAFDTHRVLLDWGDGSPLEVEGEVQDDGTVTGITLRQSPDGNGRLSARHVYQNTGGQMLTLFVTDNVQVDPNTGDKVITPASVTTTATVPVTVQPMANVTMRLDSAADPVPLGQSLAYTLTVTNEAPAGSATGLTAANVTLSTDFDQLLQITGISSSQGSCQQGSNPTCSLGSLASGNSATIVLTAEMETAVAVGDILKTGVELQHDQPDHAGEHAAANTATIVAAADFLVDTPTEAPDAAPGDGVCASSSGLCTLRAAIQEANAQSGPQSIAIGDNALLLREPGADEDGGVTGDLDITDDLTIIGLGSARSIIIGDGSDRVFDVHSVTLSLVNVGITGGSTTGDGGGLRNNGGTVQLSGAVIENNGAAAGGGIANLSGSLTFSGGSILNNSGGGILNSGTMIITDSSISFNHSIDLGAGIRHQDVGDLTLTRTTVAYNEADQVGGGLHINTPGTVTLANSTVSANQAANAAGGIYAQSGELILNNVTVADNVTADADGDDLGGGGLLVGTSATATLQHTILGQNTDLSGTAPDCDGSVISTGYNLLGDATGCTWQLQPTDLLNQAPLLQPLGNNGGLTATQALLPGSPAIDAGSCPLATATDQRGVARPQLDGCDIGAYEFEPLLIYLPVITR